MFKKSLSVLLALVMMLSVFTTLPFTVNAADTDAATTGATSGVTGGCTWTLDDNGVLTISGNGKMGDYGFLDWYERNVTRVVIQYGVTSIGTCAFSDCTGLTSVTIPDSVASIGNAAFSYCESLTSVTIPDSVMSIGNEAFFYCTSLTSVTIPDSVTSIGASAFDTCKCLKSITIPDSVMSIGNGVFSWCTSLMSIKVNINNKCYDNRNNCNAIIETSTNTLISGCQTTFIPDSVTSIGDYAFDGCTELKSVTIPDSVTSIGEDAFFCCTGLTSVTIPDSVASIGKGAFNFCESLKDVYYGGSESDWEKIKIGDNNTDLTESTIHYNSNGPDYTADAAMYCEGKKISGIDVSFNKDLFFKSSASYDHDIATLCSQMLLEGYIAEDHGAADLTASLKSLGFGNVEMNLDAGRDQMNYFIASKQIKKSGETYDLIFVGCIGSWHKQWNSNFDPKGVDSKTSYTVNSNNHRGFDDAKNYIYDELSSYLKGADKSRTKILLTGHSRGAATANLLAAELIDEGSMVERENLFTYTFATPNCTKDSARSSARYSRIFNIVYPTDFVTKVLPASWGYGRYGVTYSLPTKTNEGGYYTNYKNRMLSEYRILNNASHGTTAFHDYMLGEADVYAVTTAFSASVHGLNDFYYRTYQCGAVPMTPFIYFQSGLCPMVNHTATKYGIKASGYAVMLMPFTGTGVLYRTISTFFIGDEGLAHNFSDAHKMETYCSFMMALTSGEVTAPRRSLLGSVNCPVDVEIIDKSTGEVVGRIVNNVVDEEIAAKENAVVMTVEGDQKEYWLPYNGDYEVRLTGNDDGVMDYTLSEVDPDLGETERKNYYDIPLEKDREYVCAAESADPENSPELEDFTLTGSDDIEITPDESFTAEDAIEYTVTTETAGSGSADTVTVTSGDYATLSAVPVRSEFIGWYENDTLISKEAEYRFRPTSDLTLTAKFTEMEPLMLGDTDGDDDVTVFDAVCLQRNIADILTTAFFEQAADTDGDGEVTLMDATYIQRWLIHSKSNDNIGKLMK